MTDLRYPVGAGRVGTVGATAWLVASVAESSLARPTVH